MSLARLPGRGVAVPAVTAAILLLVIWQFAGNDQRDSVVLTWVAVGIYLAVLARFASLTFVVDRQSARLEQLVETDALTGLPNRRAWDRLLPVLHADAQRSGLLLAVLVLDLDHFKRVNDQRGHAEGDRVLGLAAAAWLRELPEGAVIVRWGGEEFVVALRVGGQAEALAAAERLRTAVPPEVTCSAGLALAGPDEAVEEVFTRADTALYRAKGDGRDRLVEAVASEPAEPASAASPVTLKRVALTAVALVALTALTAAANLVLQTVLFVAALAVAAGGVVAARRRNTSVLLSSRVLLAGFGLIIVGQVAEVASGLGGPGRVSPADLLYLAGYATVGAATLQVGRRTRGRRVGSGLDAALIGAGLTTAVLLVLSQRMPIPWYSLDGLGYAAWPLFDVLLLTMFVWLGLSPELRELDVRVMPLMLMVLLATDTALAVLEPAGRYADGDPLDAGWFLAIALVAVAAWSSARRSWRDTASAILPAWRAAALIGGTLAPVAGLALVDLRAVQVDLATLVAGTVLVVLIVVRIWTLLRLAGHQSQTLAAATRRDPLTGLVNRRGWDEHLDREFAHARRAGRRLAVAIFDLDHFRQFNAEHGHMGGDDLLRAAARAWSGCLRANDLLARWGGEEFALLTPDCDSIDAVRTLERLRAATPSGQTFSAGVTDIQDDDTPEEALGRADDALYSAKRNGRNRTQVAVPSGRP